MKKCGHCKLELTLENFSKHKSTKDGLRNQCKKCDKQSKKLYYIKNSKKETIRREKYYKKNREKILKYNKHWKKENKNELNQYRRKKYLTKIDYKLSCNLRIRINHAMKTNQKTGSAVRDLGCSIPELKTHLEKQFKDGMSWKNHGEWHIDHKIPLDSFNLIKREEFLRAVHYSNLQPMWAKDNLSKGNKILPLTT